MAVEERVGTGETTAHRSSRISDRAAATPRSGRAGGIMMGVEVVQTAERRRERRRNWQLGKGEGGTSGGTDVEEGATRSGPGL